LTTRPNELAEASDDRTLSKVTGRYGRIDLLCLDLCRHRNYADVLVLRAFVDGKQAGCGSA